jgi:hypothetical protein
MNDMLDTLQDSPSAKPKDSTTGRRARIVKKDVPSFISSETIRPLRLATTPYTLPNTSAVGQAKVRYRRAVTALVVDALEAWISQEYMASMIRGDQSSRPFLQASLTAEIREPVTCGIRLFTARVCDISQSRPQHICHQTYGYHRCWPHLLRCRSFAQSMPYRSLALRRAVHGT